MSAARSQQQKSSAFATLAVLLFVLAQASSLLHGLVRHTRCAEHGELIEANNNTATKAVSAAVVDVEAWDAAELSDEEHAHCPLTLNPGACGPVAFSQTSFQLTAFELPAWSSDIGDSSVVVACGPAVFLIAPKQGPPASPSIVLRSV